MSASRIGFRIPPRLADFDAGAADPYACTAVINGVSVNVTGGHVAPYIAPPLGVEEHSDCAAAMAGWVLVRYFFRAARACTAHDAARRCCALWGFVVCRSIVIINNETQRPYILPLERET